jgi:hypothetical protein
MLWNYSTAIATISQHNIQSYLIILVILPFANIIKAEDSNYFF